MQTFLAVVGALFLLLVLLLIGAYFWLRHKLRGLARHLAGSMPAEEITLEPTDSISWQDAAGAARRIDALKAAGFRDVGCFSVPEMEGVRLQALVNSDERAYGIVYEHPSTGVWFDVVSMMAEGCVTYNDSSMAGDMDVRPGSVRVIDTDCGPAELIRRFKVERPTVSYDPATAELFVENFTRAYREDMEWRSSRGLATEDEIRRVAERMGRGATDEEVKAVRLLYLQQQSGQLEERIRDSFLRTSNLPAREWEEVRDRLFIVSGMYSAGELMDRCREALGHPPELESMQAPERDSGGCEAMIGINDALPEKFRMRLLGSVNEPVEADLYVAPVME